MAGDWIPMRVDLADDPAVLAISEELNLDPQDVVGRLHNVWSWASHQLRNGDAPSVTVALLNARTRTPGFSEALTKVGWLKPHRGGVSFPNFDRWNSKGGKRRLLANRRNEMYRGRKRDDESVTSASTREEKRREYKKGVRKQLYDEAKLRKLQSAPPDSQEYDWAAQELLTSAGVGDYEAAELMRFRAPPDVWQAVLDQASEERPTKLVGFLTNKLEQWAGGYGL